DSDMRFMHGIFRDTDGRIRNGAFALVSLVIYDLSLGPHPVPIHDLNPGIKSCGLFCTMPIPYNAIQGHLGMGFASMEVTDVRIDDYRDGTNALVGGCPSPTPGIVSFKVVWSSVDKRLNIWNEDPVFGGFVGEFVHNTAQIEWTAAVGNLTFASAP